MHTLTERNVPHRLVVVSTDGSKKMEAVVAALLNICVDIDNNKDNAINRYVRREIEEQILHLRKINLDTEMIICAHCKIEFHIAPNSEIFKGHPCPAINLPKRETGGYAMAYARLFTQAHWCPTKDICNACAVVIPRSNDTL